MEELTEKPKQPEQSRGEVQQKESAVTDELTSTSKPQSNKSSKPSPILPKRPMSAFLLFCREKRKEVHKPGMSLTDSTLILSRLWKEMSIEEKEKHVIASDQDKKRYADQLLLIGHQHSRRRSSTSKELPSSKRKKLEPVEKVKVKPKKKKETVRKSVPPIVPPMMEPVVPPPCVGPAARQRSSLQNVVVPGTDVSVFTPEFMEYNRKLNSQLMQLRKKNNDLGEQNQRLQENVTDIEQNIVLLQTKIEQQQVQNKLLEDTLSTLKHTIADAISEFKLPNICLTSSTPEGLLEELMSYREVQEVQDFIKDAVIRIRERVSEICGKSIDKNAQVQ